MKNQSGYRKHSETPRGRFRPTRPTGRNRLIRTPTASQLDEPARTRQGEKNCRQDLAETVETADCEAPNGPRSTCPRSTAGRAKRTARGIEGDSKGEDTTGRSGRTGSRGTTSASKPSGPRQVRRLGESRRSANALHQRVKRRQRRGWHRTRSQSESNECVRVAAMSVSPAVPRAIPHLIDPPPCRADPAAAREPAGHLYWKCATGARNGSWQHLHRRSRYARPAPKARSSRTWSAMPPASRCRG